jgi:hypothetical protein
VTIDREIEFNDQIAPICLPIIEDSNYYDQQVIALGWGIKDIVDDTVMSDVPREASVKLLNSDECESAVSEMFEYSKDAMICTFDPVFDICFVRLTHVFVFNFTLIILSFILRVIMEG